MTEEDRETPIDEESYEDHPLYLAAMRVLDRGDAEDAAAKLRELAKLYPDERRLQDVLVRTELQASLGGSQPAPTVHRTPAPALGRVVLILLVVTICIIALAGFAAAYSQFVAMPGEIRQQEQEIDSFGKNSKHCKLPVTGLEVARSCRRIAHPGSQRPRGKGGHRTCRAEGSTGPEVCGRRRRTEAGRHRDCSHPPTPARGPGSWVSATSGSASNLLRSCRTSKPYGGSQRPPSRPGTGTAPSLCSLRSGLRTPTFGASRSKNSYSRSMPKWPTN